MQVQKIIFEREERVCIFRLPPTTASKGYQLGDWSDIIFEGSVKVLQKGKNLRIVFAKRDGTVFAQTKVPENPYDALIKTTDSSRGYALRLQNPKGGYKWVGLVFRDRNYSFDFNAAFVDYKSDQVRDEEVQKFGKQQVREFKATGAGKIKLDLGMSKKKEGSGMDFGYGQAAQSFGDEPAFGDDKPNFGAFQFASQPAKKKDEFDWGSWQTPTASQPKKTGHQDFFSFEAKEQPKKQVKQINLLDL